MNIATKQGAQVSQIPNPDLGVVVLVVRHQERVHLVDVLDNMYDVIRISSTTHGDNAIVVFPIFAAKLVKDIPQFFTALNPIEPVLFFVN
jgi:hypothetical protein